VAPKRVIVVGGGIAGLSAAYDLKNAGFDVLVLERSSAAGGRMADLNIRGLNVHSGATIIFSFCTDLLNLVRELGIESDLHQFPHSPPRVNNGQQEYRIKYQVDLPFVMAHPALSITTKLKLAKLLPDVLRSGLATDPNLMHTAAQFDDSSIADYLKAKGLGEFLDNYVEPLFRAPWNWEPENISRAYLMCILGHLSGAKLLSFTHGIGHLTRTLAGRLDVKLEAAVTRIVTAGSGTGKVVHYSTTDGNSHATHADIVVCAVPGNLAASLIAELPATDSTFLRSVRYTSVGIVYYLLKQKPDQYACWFSRGHPSKIVLYAQIPGDPIVPPGHVQPPHLYCELTPAVNSDVKRTRNTGALDTYGRPQARQFYPLLDEHLTDVVEQWVDEMLPEWYVGYTQAMRDFLVRHEAERSTIYFCGDYLSHSHTGGACASGRRVAGTICRHWPGGTD